MNFHCSTIRIDQYIGFAIEARLSGELNRESHLNLCLLHFELVAVNESVELAS